MINLALIVSYGLAVRQNCRGCCGIICYIIGCAIFHVDSRCALEASSVQSMVCGRTGYNIKSAFITFFATVSFIRTSVASCRLNSFCCPIFSPGKTCIYIFICCFFLLISKGKRLVTCCSYFDFKFISFCKSGSCQIKRTVFFDQNYFPFSSCCIFFSIYFYRSDVLDIISKVIF